MPQAPARGATSESSDVAKLVRLHHRRRGWAWVAIGSVIGLVVYAGIGVNLFENLTGTAETLSAIPVVRAARSGSGRASCGNRRYITHSPRRRGRPGEREGQRFALPAVRSRASLSAAPPWQLGVRHLHARRDDWYHRGYPARRGELVGICGRRGEPGHLQPGVVWSGLQQRAARGGCHTVTEGYLSTSGADVTWGSQVPLGQPFSVRDPLWAWGSGRNLTSGDGSAIPNIVAGLFFDGVTLLLLYALVVIVRDTPSRRSQRMSVPAGADPGGVRRTHHPARGHHGSGVRRPARRGRGGR